MIGLRIRLTLRSDLKGSRTLSLNNAWQVKGERGLHCSTRLALFFESRHPIGNIFVLQLCIWLCKLCVMIWNSSTMYTVYNYYHCPSTEHSLSPRDMNLPSSPSPGFSHWTLCLHKFAHSRESQGSFSVCLLLLANVWDIISLSATVLGQESEHPFFQCSVARL